MSTDPTYDVETKVHLAIDRLDVIKPGLRVKLTTSAPNGAIRQQRSLKAEVSGARKADLLVGRNDDFDSRTRALLRSNAGNPHVLASPHGRAPAFDLSNTDFRITVKRRLRHQLTEPSNGLSGVSDLCDGCNKLNCADEFGDSRLACNATTHTTNLWHNPVVYKIAELARFNGLLVSNGVHAPAANPLSGFKTDLTIRGLLPDGGVLFVDVVTATVTSKSAAINGDAAVVDGAAAAAAGAKKIDKHRDLVLAANPDNRFVPFAVEEGGRIGTDAEELVDAIVRAGSTDPTTWLSMKTFCMRALATTTAKGVARVLGRQRLSMPRRRPGGAPNGPPTAAHLAHIANISPLDGTIPPVPPATTGDLFSPSSSSSSSTTTTTSSMQPAAAMVGA